MPEVSKDNIAKMKVFGTSGSAEAYAIRDFFHRSSVPLDWFGLSTDAEAVSLAGVANLRDPRLPVCIFPDGTRLEHPTLRQITEKTGCFKTPTQAEYDLIIVGAGPAGLSAAVSAASEGLKTAVIERYAVGGQAGSTSRIENYLGFPDGISGADLALRAREQAKKFGAEILILREGVDGDFTPGRGIAYMADGTKLIMHATISATGVSYRKLGLPNEDRFSGAGLYYGAGASEAQFCKNQQVFVVGGGNSAGQAAMYFSQTASKVTVVIRGEGLKETLSQYLVDRIEASPKIEVLTQTEVTALHGDDVLRGATLTYKPTGKQQDYDTSYLFLCLGGAPHTEWAAEHGIARDEQGYLITGPDLERYPNHKSNWPLDREPYYLETNMPGLFAAGDVRHGSVKRCASAVGEGAMAVTFVNRYLAHL
jgi:thioredoxin reductase (NADPH)